MMLRSPTHILGLIVFAGVWIILSLFWAYGSFEHAKSRIVNSELLNLSPASRLFDVQNATLGFERIFVASLPERTDKRDSTSIAASLTGMSIEWIDGVDGSRVPKKAIPDSWPENESNTTLGCWRVHMNMAQKIVRENIATALILEDDADWDVNLKSQLVEFARGTRYVLGQDDKSPRSPYGDGWDILWVGHCGVRNREDIDQRYWVIHDDPTAVPQGLWGYPRRQPNIWAPSLNGTFQRVVFEPRRGLCTFGYALSHAGARRLLRDQTEVQAAPSDRALNRLCAYAGGMCLAPYPPLVGSHKGPGNPNKGSDRVDLKNQPVLEKGVTGGIVFSTRLNFWNMMQKLPIQSQWPEHTLLKEINGTVEVPKGKGVWVTKEEYVEYKRPN